MNSEKDGDILIKIVVHTTNPTIIYEWVIWKEVVIDSFKIYFSSPKELRTECINSWENW